ncbi:MAG: hypothetical protein PHV17_07885 [Candidatus Omnitrophica bacterium]|nr:hypothetical protein [Candidatus Omnitrophota bacterium]
MNTSTIFTGIFFGAIGAGYFLYGKKEKKFSALFAGALLCFAPYVITNIFLLITVGALLIVLPLTAKYL